MTDYQVIVYTLEHPIKTAFKKHWLGGMVEGEYDELRVLNPLSYEWWQVPFFVFIEAFNNQIDSKSHCIGPKVVTRFMMCRDLIEAASLKFESYSPIISDSEDIR